MDKCKVPEDPISRLKIYSICWM